MASNAGVLVAFVLGPPLPWQLLPRGVSTAWAGSSASLISNTSLVMAAGGDDSQGVMGFDPRTLPESVLNGLKEYSFRVELHAKEALKVRFCFPQSLYYSVIASPKGSAGFIFLCRRVERSTPICATTSTPTCGVSGITSTTRLT